MRTAPKPDNELTWGRFFDVRSKTAGVLKTGGSEIKAYKKAPPKKPCTFNSRTPGTGRWEENPRDVLSLYPAAKYVFLHLEEKNQQPRGAPLGYPIQKYVLSGGYPARRWKPQPPEGEEGL